MQVIVTKNNAFLKSGEFGIVYKGYIVKDPGQLNIMDIAAIKTLKGIHY